MEIAILLYDDLTALDAVGPYEVLKMVAVVYMALPIATFVLVLLAYKKISRIEERLGR